MIFANFVEQPAKRACMRLCHVLLEAVETQGDILRTSLGRFVPFNCFIHVQRSFQVSANLRARCDNAVARTAERAKAVIRRSVPRG